MWIVEIRLKDWRPDLQSGGRTLLYMEIQDTDILANADEYTVRCKAADNLNKHQATLDAILRERLSLSDIYIAEAIHLED